MNEPGKVLADIIATDMGIPTSRIVLSNQNFKAPKDDDIYIVIIPDAGRVISAVNRFDPDTNEEVKTTTVSETYNVEITSRNTDARERRYEVNQAIISTYAERQAEDNNLRIFRTQQNINLSFIEGASALHRYRIPVIIYSMKEKRTAIEPINKFPTTEVNNEPA